jgi:hypothetical protein
MIHLAMRAVADDLNTAFRRQKGDDQDRVILASLQDQQGNAPKEGENKIYFFSMRLLTSTPDRILGIEPALTETVAKAQTVDADREVRP